MTTTSPAASYEDGGETYEIEHFGTDQSGTAYFAIYCDGKPAGELRIRDAREIPGRDELIEMARAELAGDGGDW